MTFIRPLDRPESDCGGYEVDSMIIRRVGDGGVLKEGPTWIGVAQDAVGGYQEERAAGRKREFARYLLPHCLEVWMAMTCNFREWQHVLRMRTQKAAAPEMRLIFGQVKEQLGGISPVLVEGA